MQQSQQVVSASGNNNNNSLNNNNLNNNNNINNISNNKTFQNVDLSPKLSPEVDKDEMFLKKYSSAQNIKMPNLYKGKSQHQTSKFELNGNDDKDELEEDEDEHSSQINNISNEWNEQQDEKVNIQRVIISFSAKTVMMNKK